MRNFIQTAFAFLLLLNAAYAQEECTEANITETKGGGTYCLGEEVTLEISGELNDAENWQWYTGSCGGEIIADATGTSITVVVEESVNYYVRGVGGCVTEDASCSEIQIILDEDPPMPTCPENITVNTDPDVCEATVTYEMPTAEDHCDDEIAVEQTEGLGSGAVFPLGVTTETYTFTDSEGNMSECSFTVTVTDNQAPEIICAPDIETNNDPGVCGAVVTYDPPTAVDNCSEVKVVLTSGPGSGSEYPVGVTTDIYTATDAAGNTSTCEINITVYDVEPPVITVSDKKTSKWPPNHKPFEIDINDYILSVTDNCPGVSIEDVIIDYVTSDEEANGSGDGNTSDDIVIHDDCKTVSLLAERSGGGNGRVYTVNLAVEDAHGNIGYAEIKAEISHDKSKKKTVIDDGVVYTVNGCDIEPESSEPEMTEEETESDAQENMNGSRSALSIQTYPNPFNNEFKINFMPGENDFVEISLYDLSGKKVRTLYQGNVTKGILYSETYDAGNSDKELLLLVIKGQKTHSVKKIIKE